MAGWFQKVKRLYNAYCEEAELDWLRPEMDRALGKSFEWFGLPADANRGYSLVNWDHSELLDSRSPFNSYYTFMLPVSAHSDRNAFLCAALAFTRTMVQRTGFIQNTGCSFVLQWSTILRYLHAIGYDMYARMVEQDAFVTQREPILPHELLAISSQHAMPRGELVSTDFDLSRNAARVARAISLVLGTAGILELSKASSVNDWIRRCDAADLPGIAELLGNCKSIGQGLSADRPVARDPEFIRRFAIALLWLGYPESGLLCLSDALRVRSSGEAPDHLTADLNIFAGNVGDGLRMYERLIIAQPDNMDIMSDLCYHLIHQDLPDKALHYGSRLLDTPAATPNLIYQIGLAHWLLRDLAAAERIWSAIPPTMNSLFDESIRRTSLGRHPDDLPFLTNL